MQFGTITSQGQITIPAQMRKALGVDKNPHVVLTKKGNTVVIEPARDIMQLAGSLHKYAMKGKSIKEIRKIEEAGLEDAIVERYLEKEKRSGNKLLVI